MVSARKVNLPSVRLLRILILQLMLGYIRPWASLDGRLVSTVKKYRVTCRIDFKYILLGRQLRLEWDETCSRVSAAIALAMDRKVILPKANFNVCYGITVRSR